MKDKVTFVVSGYMRTGTSMMMKALEKGGMEAAYNTDRNKLNDLHGDEHYTPNLGGYYELKHDDYLVYGFPREYKGKVIKILGKGIWNFVKGNYKIVYMKRDFEEIRQSFEAFFDKPIVVDEKRYYEIVKDSLDIIEVRQDMEVTVFNYRDVVENPKESFTILANKGWPIDVDKAVDVVDPAQYRFRLENLAVGI